MIRERVVVHSRCRKTLAPASSAAPEIGESYTQLVSVYRLTRPRSERFGGGGGGGAVARLKLKAPCRAGGARCFFPPPLFDTGHLARQRIHALWVLSGVRLKQRSLSLDLSRRYSSSPLFPSTPRGPAAAFAHPSPTQYIPPVSTTLLGGSGDR
ncbi:hypothetical protein MRX96_026905 [Rhipicephalus microplus]